MRISTESLVKVLENLKSGSRADQMYYLAWLKKFIQIGKQMYHLKPDEQFKNDLIRLAKHVQTFEPKSTWVKVEDVLADPAYGERFGG